MKRIRTAHGSRRRGFPFKSQWFFLVILVVSIGGSLGCVQERAQVREPPSLRKYYRAHAYPGPRYTIVLGDVKNESTYMRGIFSDGKDRLGQQARGILKTHLSECGRFRMLERQDLEKLRAECEIAGKPQNLIGGQFLINGTVTEFGRKETGTKAAGGSLGRSKTQTAHATLSLFVVNVTNSAVVFSAQGSGDYHLTTREVLGFGGTAGYDSTLNDKVLNLAMMKAVVELIRGLETGAWSPK
jgi:curli biogenesis system outer membrane secretion channel CsgG